MKQSAHTLVMSSVLPAPPKLVSNVPGFVSLNFGSISLNVRTPEPFHQFIINHFIKRRGECLGNILQAVRRGRLEYKTYCESVSWFPLWDPTNTADSKQEVARQSGERLGSRIIRCHETQEFVGIDVLCICAYGYIPSARGCLYIEAQSSPFPGGWGAHTP